MSTGNMTIAPRVNFFDGQKLSESDLDQEQIHLRGLTSGHVSSAHGSGILKDSPLESFGLFKLSNPGLYGENPSKYAISSGQFDGRPIYLDRQPSNSEFGKRLIFKLENAKIKTNYPVKIIILGSKYNPLDNRGEIVTEYLEFLESSEKISENYYKHIYAIYFNNLSGGTGLSEYSGVTTSYNYLNDQSIELTIFESDAIKIFPKSLSVLQNESPNFYLNNFSSYSTDVTLLEAFGEALDETFSTSEIYYETSPAEVLSFTAGGSSSVAFGQKFLAKTKGLQKISLLLGIDTAISDTFSGNLVISIHKLTTAANCITDAVPDNLINFDPESISIVESSYSYEDFLAMGIKLSSTPSIVSFDFSSTLLGNINLDPSLDIDSYYCFILKRVGDTSTGTVNLFQGYDKAYRKGQNGQNLTIQEEYESKTTIFTEFDPINNKFVDDSDRSLWFELHSSSIEISSGKAIAEDGVPFEIPEFIEYIGNNLIPFTLKNIELQDTSGGKNYIILDRSEKFTTPIAHPRTGNYTFTRILDSYEISILSESSLNSILDLNPNILGYVIDRNDRSPSDISGTYSYIGQITPDKIYFINPPSYLMNKAILNRIFIPDTSCGCSAQYKIDSLNCSIQKTADLTNDGKITYQDLDGVIGLAGNALTSSVTQNLILNGTINLVDFYKSDVDNDGIIDGSDISLIEDAIDGYVNFSVPEEFTVLELSLANIDSSNNNPLIFEDSAATGSTITSSNQIIFTITSDSLARIIRAGDRITIPETEVDAGTYLISSISYSSLVATAVVTHLDESVVTFTGSVGFNPSVYSGTEVNTFADNKLLVNLPFNPGGWTITSSGNLFSDRLLSTIDLRRFTEQSVLEVKTDECICTESSCFQESDIYPVIKNQKVIPNDLYIPNGDILSAPGIPHHGDFEYVNVILPLPPGSIEDCSIDIYNTFIKSSNGTCLTEAGYPAMKYSDGTLVGCNDSGSQTDLSLGRVKIAKAISSLYVDAFIDGYAVDGYTVESTSTSNIDNIILDSSNPETYPDSFVPSEVSAVPYDPTTMWLMTIPGSTCSVSISLTYCQMDIALLSSGGLSDYATLERPPLAPSISGDFTISFTGIRESWDPAKLVLGNVFTYGEITMANSYGGTSTLKLGWRQYGDGDGVELFWSGTVDDSSSTIYTFDYSIPAPESEGEEINFRIRRVNDITTAYYYYNNADSLVLSQEYIKIGEILSTNPGEGDASFMFKVEATNSAGVSADYTYSTRFLSDDFQIAYNEVTSDESLSSEILIGENSSKLNELTFNFPLELTSKTQVISATVELTASQDFAVTSTNFKLIPYENLNADNISKYIDLILSNNSSIISSVPAMSGVAGEVISLDITDAVKYLLVQPGHLPGYYKAFKLTSDPGELDSFSITNSITVTITYYDITTGVIFKVGSTLDPATGVLTLKTKNILYDSVNSENRTTINLGVYLKKSGFKNSDLTVSLNDISRLGIGTCVPANSLTSSDDCFFVTGSTGTGLFVEGPFPCSFLV